MNDSFIKKAGQWAAYIGAIARWFSISITSFPKKGEFFPPILPSSNNSGQTDGGGV
jgi:hypothetical protein